MKTALVIAVMIMLTGCMPRFMTGPETEYRHAGDLVKEKKYRAASEMYRKIADEYPQSWKAADALFESASLDVFYDNPQRDYTRALRGFDDFLKRFPDDDRSPEARTWKAVLKTLLETKKENERLNQSIEELKMLDIRHEERRVR